MQTLRQNNQLTTDNLPDYVNSIHCFDNRAIFTDPNDLPNRIVAIGDVHGDLESLFLILLKAEVINIVGKWIALDTFVVQTGDIFDKGRNLSMLSSVGIRPDNVDTGLANFVPYDIIDKLGNVKRIDDPPTVPPLPPGAVFNEPFGEEGDELIILKFLADLNIQAISGEFGNSRVLLCCGNHEVSNVMEYLDDNYHHAITNGYVHPMDTVLFGGPNYPTRQALLTVGTGLLAQKLACTMKVIVVVGHFIFCHGGVDANTLRDINSIDELDGINEMFRQFLLGTLPDVDMDRLRRYISDANQNSIVWFREQGDPRLPNSTITNPNRICRNTISLFSQKFGNPHFNLVIGHTTQQSCIDPKSKNDRTIPRVRVQWARTNPDGTVDECITLPTLACDNQIYRIDTASSRMMGAHDYRYPLEGRSNSLIINLNADGSKNTVFANNGILGNVQLYPQTP
jgi:hypothetical protein